MIIHHLKEALRLAQLDEPLPRGELLEAIALAEDLRDELLAQYECDTLPPRLAAAPKRRTP